MWNWYPRGVEDALELVQKGKGLGVWLGQDSRGTGRDGIDSLEASPCVSGSVRNTATLSMPRTQYLVSVHVSF